MKVRCYAVSDPFFYIFCMLRYIMVPLCYGLLVAALNRTTK